MWGLVHRHTSQTKVISRNHVKCSQHGHLKTGKMTLIHYHLSWYLSHLDDICTITRLLNSDILKYPINIIAKTISYIQYVCTFKALWNESMIDSDFTPSVNLPIHTSKEMLVTEFYCLHNIICDCQSKNPTCSQSNWNSFYCSSL